MSSEVGHDHYYEQFTADAQQESGLLSDSFLDSLIGISYDNLQETFPNEYEQGAPNSFQDIDVSEQAREFPMMDDLGNNLGFGPAGTMQPFFSGAHNPSDFTMTFEGAGQWNLFAGEPESQDAETVALEYPSPQLRTEQLESVPPCPQGIYENLPESLATRGNDVALGAHVSALDPISLRRHDISAQLHRPCKRTQRDIEWTGPQKCDLQGCASKVTFRTRSSLMTHINNIHVDPLICTYPGCSYKKPFGKRCDVVRHMNTVHGTESQFPCLEHGCQEVFARKDKMMKHAKEKHQLFECIRNHCSVKVFAAELETHLQDSHGNCECAIGSCKIGDRSYFTKTSLRRHLRTCHRLTYHPIEETILKTSNTKRSSRSVEKDGVFYAEAPKVQRGSKYRDCQSCSGYAQIEH